MGEAILEAIELVKLRKRQYQANGVAYYRPWIFLVTDGAPTDDWQAAAKAVQAAEKSKSLAFFPVGVDGADFGLESAFAPPPHQTGRACLPRVVPMAIELPVERVEEQGRGAAGAAAAEYGAKGLGDHRVSRWVWAGASAAGTSHAALELPCQDAFACRVWQRDGQDPVLIAVVADGAGSAHMSQVGAALSASLVRAGIVTEALDAGIPVSDVEDTLLHALSEVRRLIGLKAAHDGNAIDDYAATLLVAIAGTDGAIFAQIGDGAIVVDDGERGWRPVHWPDHGEYANTTSFLTQDAALDALRVEVTERPVRRLAMFTDGLERLVLDFRSRSAHAPFFDRITEPLASSPRGGEVVALSDDLEAFLYFEKVNARTDDDKTFLCAAFIGE